jgi:hypothetical protein
LTHTAVGPVDITRGTLGLSVGGVQSAVRGLRRRSEKGRLASRWGKEIGEVQEALGKEIAAAQQVVADLPQAFAEARHPKRRRLPWIIVAGVATIAAGGVAFAIIRRSLQPPHPRPEPSPRPPSVDFEPKP